MTEPTSIPSSSLSSATPPVSDGLARPVSGAGVVASDLPVVMLANEPVHAISEADCLRIIMDALAAGVGGWVLTVNTDILRRLRRESAFSEMAAQVTLRVPDGIPLLWAAALQNTPLPERVAGSNLIDSLTAEAADHGRSVFFLGGAEGAAAGTAEVFRSRYPNLRVAGTYCPPMGFEEDPREMERLSEALVAAQPDIVYVALGCPKQERVIGRFRGQFPGAWWLGVGISFSFMSGQIRRAPSWMQRIGLEWLFRLSQEPRRLARRYLIEDLPYGFYLLGTALRRRWRGGAASDPGHAET